MEPLDQLIMWEYRVEQSQTIETDEGPIAIWFIEGPGMSTYVRGDDADALAALADVEAHEERVKQASETPEETQARLNPEAPGG